jgi:hypothetical protein
MSRPALADCCQECDPFDPAVVPLTVTSYPGHPDSLRASYRCPRGHEWHCGWDAAAADWPTERRPAA